MAEILARSLSQADIEDVMPLMIQLGYEINIEELKRRFAAISTDSSHAVFCAEMDGRLVGFCHAYARPALEKPVEGVVQSLVVDSDARGLGVGEQLMQSVEDWARENGLASMSLYSQVTRKDAHAFYEHLGYETVAQSSLMRKSL